MNSGRRVLVLGGTSYVGKYLVEMLLQNGDHVTLATRGNTVIPPSCNFIFYERGKGNIFPDSSCWDVVYDQSCYQSSYLYGLENTILTCGKYVMTSSQAVYPFGYDWQENSIQYDNNVNLDELSEYGLEKLRSEIYVSKINPCAVFPRFPTIVGTEDPRRRIQSLIDKIMIGSIDLPINNTLFHLIDAYDAAKALMAISNSDLKCAVNISSYQTVDPHSLCSILCHLLEMNVNYEYLDNYIFNQFDLIKSNSKTLNLTKQSRLGLSLKNFPELLADIVDHYRAELSLGTSGTYKK